MSRRLPPLNAIRAFEAAGRHSSLTKAAAELGVTHGAVSRHVTQLEAWLGVPLFIRQPARLILTEAGRRYLAETTAALDRLALATLQLRDQAVPETLRVNAPPTFTMRWLIPRMSGFQRRHAEVEVRLTTSLDPVVFDGSYDIAIRGAQAPSQVAVSEPFMTEVIVPVCHADLTERGRLKKPTDLAHCTLIAYATQPYSWPEWLEEADVPQLRATGTLQFEQMYFALQAAAEGLGVVLVPIFLVIDEIVTGRLCIPFGRLGARERRYYANANVRTPLISDFIVWLIREGRDTENFMNRSEVLGD
jgi:LysR family glycine cleavage system transcriptional activator